jgi:hypothetical protein
MGFINGTKPIRNKRMGTMPNAVGEPRGHQGQLLKRKAKNRIMDEIRFQSRKGNR